MQTEETDEIVPFSSFVIFTADYDGAIAASTPEIV